MRRSAPSNGAAAPASEAPPLAVDAAPHQFGQGVDPLANDPLALHEARARSGAHAPRATEGNWKNLRYNITGVYADAFA